MASNNSKVCKTATEALKALWEQGFFRTWKSKAPIEECLAKCGNHFSIPELGMALMRARHLTRRGKRGSYEYIQKYPFVKDEIANTSKKKA